VLWLGLVLIAGPESTWAADAFGVWQVHRNRSTGPHSDILAVRFELHSKGEVFTLQTTDSSGRSATSSTILYFDGKPRDFQDSGCSGVQSSRRLDSLTIEIVRQCRSGDWTKFVRRLAREGEQNGPGGQRTTLRRPLRPPAGIREAIRRNVYVNSEPVGGEAYGGSGVFYGLSPVSLRMETISAASTIVDCSA